MTQLRVRDLRKDSRETEKKKIRKYFILKSSCNFEKPAALNWKRFANRALLTIAATLLNDKWYRCKTFWEPYWHYHNLFTREITRQVARGVLISYEMRLWWRPLSILSILVMLNITVTTDQALSLSIHARRHEWWSYTTWMCLWWRSLRIFSIHNKYRKWQCSIS